MNPDPDFDQRKATPTPAGGRDECAGRTVVHDTTGGAAKGLDDTDSAAPQFPVEDLSAEAAIEDFREALASGRLSGEEIAGLQRVLASPRLGSQAIELLTEAAGVLPDEPSVLFRVADMLGRFGVVDESISCFRRALALEPENIDARLSLGTLLSSQDRRDEAAECLRAASRLAPDREDVRYFLATLAGDAGPDAAPATYVAKLFDEYADRFDRHLVGELRYRTPQLLRRAVGAATKTERADWRVWDLGCGTGLCGPMFRDLAGHLTGIDLSPRMVDKARERSVYDDLRVDDLTAALEGEDETLDLVIAADVFVYIGNLAPVFEVCRDALRPGGWFAFTTEIDDRGPYTLHAHGRYGHDPDDIESLAREIGFSVVFRDECDGRLEKGQPVKMAVHVLRRDARHSDRASVPETTAQRPRLAGAPSVDEPNSVVVSSPKAGGGSDPSVWSSFAEIDASLESAMSLHRAGDFSGAERMYAEVLSHEPNNVNALHLLGALRLQGGDPAGAADLIERAIDLKPGFVDAHANLGAALVAQGRAVDAEQVYRKALELEPGRAETWFNLANLLRDEDRPAEAEAAYSQALGFQPDLAVAHLNLGCLLQSQDRIEEAAAAFRSAVDASPDFAEAFYNLGGALGRLGKREPAESALRQAVAVDPSLAVAHKDLAHILLRSGRFAEGWSEYEWRWHVEPFTEEARRFAHRPMWDGSNLDGRTILLHAEQGLGDTIQFVRYATMVTSLGGHVILECQAPLARLLGELEGIEVVPAGNDLPDFDVHCPLMSLPGIFGTTLETIPGGAPYLRPPSDAIERFRNRLDSGAGLRVGLAWQGNPEFAGDRARSMPLARLAPVSRVPGVRLFSLQKGFGQEQLADLPDDIEIVDLGSEVDDFADTAAVMQHLDLVIACDTAVAHLAGALGRPVWVMLPFAPDWRWMLEREDSPWYGTMRLFRQTTAGDWDGVVARVAEALCECAAEWRAPARDGRTAACAPDRRAASTVSRQTSATDAEPRVFPVSGFAALYAFAEPCWQVGTPDHFVTFIPSRPVRRRSVPESAGRSELSRSPDQGHR